MKRALVAISLVFVLLFVAGCAQETAEQPTTESSVSTEGITEATTEATTESERTLTFDLYGEEREVIVPSNPKRVVVIGYDALDIVDTLGLSALVVGTVDPNSPSFPTFLDGYENTPSIGSLFGDDLEAVAALQPDLIIGGSRTLKVYDDLNSIAPTVWFSIPGMGSPYEEKLYSNIRFVADLFNMQEQAEDEISKLKLEFTKMKETIGNLENPTALFLQITGKNIGAYSDDADSRYGFVFHEFGFTTPASLDEIKNDSAAHGDSVSYEFINAKNPNYLIVIDRGAATGETGSEASDTLDNPLVAATDAVKNDHVIYLDGTSWYLSTGGIQSTYLMIENLTSQLK
jgi:iron complex transport system substrate-binding protein